ncbi:MULTISPECIES: type I-E CRISPR-associated protein Cse1/CasA [unclassified Saccharopolyspora]|uniref:type I-E CRISPR-associated protein Cse1/CasA n=1 Tax=unclassified Saccharopolyspora TaxID=2646250 RepID=UPI001CD3DE70|nr:MULTISPECIES: type I-E CRISPR-associated protein Cse1/CasA [unclassified Saccharopolyspora]MCA1188772.1 type I-E CRISPR-associated protein Cse1/CasA [Saccharopolyspora sp. 6T]MCA1283264.1 type I-E CRISPR-associated protein Cse1/CasA [Saccharopolyspora sp. 7B]
MPVPSYDVRDQPWIPVRTLDRATETISLRDLLHRAHELRDLAITIPPAASAVLRVLYTLAARITQLDQSSAAQNPEWWERHRRATFSRGRFDPDAVDTELGRVPDRWDLFDATHPWMQDPRLHSEAGPVGINRLDPRRPADNSPVWFRHTHRGNAAPIPTPEAILWLLVHHLYGPGGGGGTRTVDSPETGEQVSDQYMSAGPLRAALTHYPLGRTLFETLVAGIPAKPKDIEPGEDLAPWERDELPAPLHEPPPITWPAGLLCGRGRHALLLRPDPSGQWVTDARITWAFKKPATPINDPYCIVERKSTGEWNARRTDADRALWRDIDALLADSEFHRRPDIIASAFRLPPDVARELRVRVHGIDQDRQATDRQWITATTPPLFPWLAENDNDAAHGAAVLRAAAETVEGVMRHALRQAYQSLTATGMRPSGGEVPWIQPARAFYWPRAEELFWERMYAEPRDFTRPFHAFTVIAVHAVEHATDHDAHQTAVARAVAGAVKYLNNHARKKEPPPRGAT